MTERVGELARILLHWECAAQLAGRIVVEKVWRAEQPLAIGVSHGQDLLALRIQSYLDVAGRGALELLLQLRLLLPELLLR